MGYRYSQQLTSESEEIIFYASGRRGTEVDPPPTLSIIRRVNSIKALGVKINYRLSMNGHIGAQLYSCSRALVCFCMDYEFSKHTACVRTVCTTSSDARYLSNCYTQVQLGRGSVLLPTSTSSTDSSSDVNASAIIARRHQQ